MENSLNMNLKIFSGTSHPDFAKKICEYLGVPLGTNRSFTFSNNNRFITIDEPVRGSDVYFIQTSTEPVDAYLMELFIFIRTLRDASAARITAVLPYFPYVRSDKKDQPRVCITARLVADLIEKAGANRVLTMDLHSPQIQGFFSIPCDHLFTAPDSIAHLTASWDLTNYVLVAGDSGASKMVKIFADALKLPIAIMDKRREDNSEEPLIKGVIGEVQGKRALLIDDEISSGSTLIRDAHYLLESAGVVEVDACVVHPVLGVGAVEKLNVSPIHKFVVTNTIPTDGKNLKNMEIVDVSKRMAECIRRLHTNESIKSLNEIA